MISPPTPRRKEQEENASEASASAAPEKLSAKEKFAYGLGVVPNQHGEAGFNRLVNEIPMLTLGMNPATVGYIAGAIRLWDAITDPIVGTLSDNSKLKGGRRKPFMLLGCLLMAVTYPALWYASPEWTDNAKTIYFGCACVIFFTTYTIFSVPFRALGTEITPDYEERTNLQVYAAYIGKAYALVLPWIYYLSLQDIFGDPVTGIRVLTALSGVLLLICGVICSRVPKERYRNLAAEQEKVNFFASLKSLLSDKPFLILHGIGLGLLCSILLVDALSVSINIFYVWGGDRMQGAKFSGIGGNIMMVMGMIMLFVLNKYLIHIDKRKILVGALALALIGSVSKWFLFTPENPYLTLVVPFFYAPAYTAFWAIFMSLLGDYCDYDEHKNGKRREAVFCSLSGWIMKAGSSLAIAINGSVLMLTGFVLDLEGDQPDGVFLYMRLFIVVIPFTLLAMAIFCALVYPLSKNRMLTIRSELEARRGTVS